MIAALLILATYLFLGLPVALFGIPWRLVTGNIMPLYRGSMFVVRLGLRLAGIRVQVEGLEGVPESLRAAITCSGCSRSPSGMRCC